MATGLRNVAKQLGGITVKGIDGKETRYVWDYAADEIALEAEMKVGSKRWKASEKAKYEALRRGE